MSNIFANNAPLYWAAGLPAIPLEPRSKRTIIQGWTRWCTEDIPDETKAAWLHSYPDGNIGLALGEMSGLVALDLDTDDERVRNIILRLLPPTPWIRRGKKGAVYIYRWQGHKTFRIRTMEGSSLLEVLSSGTQIVLPPSIHPDTGMPYTANANLWDVLDQIPVMPRQTEIVLRQALIEEGIQLSTKGYTKVTEWISVGARDSKMVSVAGLMARGVIRGERSLFEAVGEIRAWVDNFVEKVAGDQMDPEKAVAKLIEFIKRDIVEGGKILPHGWDDDLTEEEAAKFRAEFGVEKEEWDVEKVLQFLQTTFEAHDRVEGMRARREAIEKALQKIAMSPSILPMDHDQIFQYINQGTGRMVTIASLRKRLQQLTKVEGTGESHAEIAQLVLADMQQYGEIRFSTTRFWQWRGACWEELHDHEILARVTRDFGHLPAAKRHSDHKGIMQTMAALSAGDLAQSSVRGLNFANGFLTSDLTLREHDPNYGCTYVLPYKYDPGRNGACPRFLSFLNQSWGRDPDYAEKVQALREAIAVTLFGLAAPFQKVFCLYGVPHSGKSVLMDIIRSILPPEAACAVGPDAWDDKFLPTQMVNKLANFCGELSEHTLIPGDKFKHIVDGGEISGQLKGKQIFLFRPTLAHWFASNHLPKTRDASAGFSRRWLFFRFNHPVRKEDRVTGLANDIAAEECDAIVAWAVAALPEVLRTSNFTTPASHVQYAEEMAGMNNSVRFFLRGGPVRIGPQNSNSISEMDLHGAYWSFCKLHAGARPVSLKIFRQRASEMADELGFKIRMITSQNMDEAVYDGITLAPERGMLS